MRRSEDVLNVFWRSHVRSIYVLCLRGGKCQIISLTIISCTDWMRSSIFFCWTRKEESMEAVWRFDRCARLHLQLPFTRKRKYSFVYSWEIYRIALRSNKRMDKHKWNVGNIYFPETVDYQKNFLLLLRDYFLRLLRDFLLSWLSLLICTASWPVLISLMM